MAEPVTIVGGGLAGLTLGIGLRQQGVPTTVCEAGHYPRHRVCGEFISGAGLATLSRLGLLERLREAGAAPLVSAAFFDGNRTVASRPLPETAIGLSRSVLDHWLAREFESLGGLLKTGVRWTGGYGPGIVRASGRRPEPVSIGWRLFGLKAHARDIALDADLEMHFLPSGYVGLCRLADGEVNVCGLFRSETAIPDLARRWRDHLGGPANSVLRARLANARFEESSFCSVAGLALRPGCAGATEECRIGDTLTMIPPVTGNGMSMAFESAEVAVESLARFSRGELSWTRAREQIARSCDQRFASRLRWAARLQRALFHPYARSMLMGLVRRSDWLWRQAFAWTR